MDESVLAAMARWPGVPHVYGWLSLTARGQWRLRGEPIVNPAIRDFIGRNYGCDEDGRWFFQNGPQRVYVTLELTPWVYRVQQDGSLAAHTGARPRELRAAALVDDATIVLLTDLGPGNVDDRDAGLLLAALTDRQGRPLVEAAVESALAGGKALWISAGRLGMDGELVPVRRLGSGAVATAFGFVAEPRAP